MNKQETIKQLEDKVEKQRQLIRQYEVQIGNLFAQVAGLNLALSRMDEHLRKEVRYP